MREMTSILLRGLCLAAVLTAGSCSSPSGDEKTIFDDPAAKAFVRIDRALHDRIRDGGIRL